MDLERVREVVGAIPEGAGQADPARFVDLARAGLAPLLGGTFDAADFTARIEHAPQPKDPAE